MSACPTCGWPVATADDVIAGRATYDDTQGGHNDRHTLVVEDAESLTHERCHCGQPVHYGYDGDPTHHRGMCEHCDAVRCDAYPGECKR